MTRHCQIGLLNMPVTLMASNASYLLVRIVGLQADTCEYLYRSNLPTSTMLCNRQLTHHRPCQLGRHFVCRREQEQEQPARGLEARGSWISVLLKSKSSTWSPAPFPLPPPSPTHPSTHTSGAAGGRALHRQPQPSLPPAADEISIRVSDQIRHQILPPAADAAAGEGGGVRTIRTCI